MPLPRPRFMGSIRHSQRLYPSQISRDENVLVIQSTAGQPDFTDLPQQTVSTDANDRRNLQDQNGQEIVPRLPLDIEYEIFTLAFKINQKDCTKLMCVAKRVEEWVAPLIYKVLVFTSIIGKKPSLFAFQRYGHHVHHILVTCSIQAFDFSTYCPNIWDLGLWFKTSLDERVFGLNSLKRLVLNDLDFVRTLGRPGGSSSGSAESNPQDLTTPNASDAIPSPSIQPDIEKKRWFSNITHIVVSKIPTVQASTALRQFPNLTHLMLVSSNAQEILQHILRTYPTLKVVVWLLLEITSDDKIAVVSFNSVQAPRTDDERVVTIDCNFTAEWTKAAKGEIKEDVWAVAERTVEERKKQRVRI